jgi:hypothetical protein
LQSSGSAKSSKLVTKTKWTKIGAIKSTNKKGTICPFHGVLKI